MQAVITADLIHSRKQPAALWMPVLTDQLEALTPDWEIYRGDSFQLLLPAEEALSAVFLLKARLKQMYPLDLRAAIGLGEVTYQAAQITQSNGSAFVYSGTCFDALKKCNLALMSQHAHWDTYMNLLLLLTSTFADHWSAATARVLATALSFPEQNQNQWAQRLQKSQSTINAALKRGNYDELKRVIDYYAQEQSKL